jgi:hypothetical protein
LGIIDTIDIYTGGAANKLAHHHQQKKQKQQQPIACIDFGTGRAQQTAYHWHCCSSACSRLGFLDAILSPDGTTPRAKEMMMSAMHTPTSAVRTDDAYRVLLSQYDGQHFYLPDKKVAAALNKAVDEINKGLPSGEKLASNPFAGGKNHEIGTGRKDIKTIGVSEDTLHAILARGDKGSKLLMETFMSPPLRLDREAVAKALTGQYMPAHDTDRDAQQILQSPLFAARDEARLHGRPSENLQALSRNNLEAVGRQIGEYKQDKDVAPYSKIIDMFTHEVAARYEHAGATHATNQAITGCISPTTDRQHIESLAIQLTGTKTSGPKLTHTSATNTAQIQTHDFVFFNIYPQTGPEVQKEQLLSTRYLLEKPEIKGSPYAADARSFTLPLDALAGRTDKLTVVALRDPVYPAGGTSETDVRKRMEQPGIATCTRTSPEVGTAHRHLGALEDSYRTHENVFVGEHIKPALIMNVELGLQKTFKGLHMQDGPDNRESGQAYNFFKRLDDTLKMTDGPAKDRAVMGVIKLYQYPQLLVSGAVSVQGIEPFRPLGQHLSQNSNSSSSSYSITHAPDTYHHASSSSSSYAAPSGSTSYSSAHPSMGADKESKMPPNFESDPKPKGR